jgi:ABC-type antimicrobial peptide transport system permease subunit
MTWEDIPMVFRPISQDPPSRVSIALRTLHDEPALGMAVQKQIAALDPSVPASEVQTLDAHLSRALAYPRFRALVLGTFAGLALLLAAVGLYGVLSQLIAQRTQEFGVRIALGAQKRNILALVIRQGMILTVAGLAAGFAVSLSLTRLLSSLLYGVTATDPWTLVCVSVLLLAVALLAVSVPARRASKVDPIVALRYE